MLFDVCRSAEVPPAHPTTVRELAVLINIRWILTLLRLVFHKNLLIVDKHFNDELVAFIIRDIQKKQLSFHVEKFAHLLLFFQFFCNKKSPQGHPLT